MSSELSENVILTPLESLQIIGIAGHAGAGKDTITDYIGGKYIEVYREAFADPLKQACSVFFGIDLNDFYETEIKEQKNEFWGWSPREIAQFIGTEFFRKGLRSDFFIRRLEGKLTGQNRSIDDGNYTPGDTVIIPDVRFQNEYDWILDSGGWIIHVIREGKNGDVGIPNHASEKELVFRPNSNNWIINNSGTLEELYEQINSFILHSGFNFTPCKFNLEDF